MDKQARGKDGQATSPTCGACAARARLGQSLVHCIHDLCSEAGASVAAAGSADLRLCPRQNDHRLSLDEVGRKYEVDLSRVSQCDRAGR